MKVKLRVMDLELASVLLDNTILNAITHTAGLLRHPESYGDVIGSEHWSEIRITGPRVMIVACWFDESGGYKDEVLVDQIASHDLLYNNTLAGLQRVGILKIDESESRED